MPIPRSVLSVSGVALSMKQIAKVLLVYCLLSTTYGCNYVDDIKTRIDTMENYRVKSLALARENRHLKAEISRLRFEIQSIKAKNALLQTRLDDKVGTVSQKNRGRAIASVKAVYPKNDLVKYKVYNWKADKMLAIAEDAYKKKQFKKSAQFFKSLTRQFPNHKLINDGTIFKAGMASLESEIHTDWALQYFNRILHEYPTSKYFRSAKLWVAITHLKSGKKKEFVKIVEEFRKKYRNTPEWEILSRHYEKIMHKYDKVN